MRRVVITGMGLCSPLGCGQDEVMQVLRSCKNAVQMLPELQEYRNMTCALGAPVTGSLPDYPRKKTRSMGRLGILAVTAAGSAIEDAGLAGSPELTDGTAGIACGSSAGAMSGMQDVAGFLTEKDIVSLNATTYVQIMPHTCAVNISLFFGITGRIIATSTACTSGAQALGYAYEAIKCGAQDLMVAGGAEELSPLSVGIFDVLYATSGTRDPALTPRPFDKTRDGIVVGEGAGMLILEEYEHAVRRGARIYAEIVGFATNADASHVTSPSTAGMEKCMRLALKNAGLSPESIGYINAHGTGTVQGDLAEGQAMYRIFGNRTPVATLKSYMGHTLGAAGALEAAMTIMMQRAGWFAPNLNLATPDPEIGDLAYIRGEGVFLDTEYVMSNNFAFGGVNTSLIFRKPESGL
ncbi:beta-ketoacyl-ACP synthase [Succinimonas amylolytica]|uniref:beta-ketoacyl-ACP synthase n=1 Tax=Succinimonas amylolytica TaxID=83769 RepID=UPI00037E9B6B|nr:beta-ketoacyl-ACP synthase [Succinimonas amylolytica]